VLFNVREEVDAECIFIHEPNPDTPIEWRSGFCFLDGRKINAQEFDRRLHLELDSVGAIS